ncbi:MAG: radical SAM family heme chaperone HemW [Phycisphaeraceae bacterium]|nr:radical SAM family heme chaperone HemW [Phycisphaeraceae bacterium]
MRHDTSIPLWRQRPLSAAVPLGLAPAGKETPAAPASAPSSVHPKTLARSLYIHIPFCFHKCHYCDFYSIVDTRDRQEPFTNRLIRELRALSPMAGTIETIFIGGGTPSLLRPPLWRELLRTLREAFDMTPTLEFTVECNPETVTPELMDMLAAGGVNRVSMGAQSFDTRHLKTLERWHNPESVALALAAARRAGIRRQNIDLIFGIPGQTLAEWERDLATALDLGTTHLSCYNLTYEPNTAMTARLKRGEFRPADEDTEVEMYGATLRLIRSRGMDRYEVSNYAGPGEECRHNLAYWRAEDWLAAGPSASGHFRGHRWKNTPRLDDYLDFDDNGLAPITEWEPPDPARALRERIMTGLRTREGLVEQRLHTDMSEAGVDPQVLGRHLADVTRQGLAERSGGSIRLTDHGMLLADGIAGSLMDLVPST